MNSPEPDDAIDDAPNSLDTTCSIVNPSPTPKASSISTTAKSLAIPLSDTIKDRIEAAGGKIYSTSQFELFHEITSEKYPKIRWNKQTKTFPHNYFVPGLKDMSKPVYFCKGCGKSYVHPHSSGGGAGGCRFHVERCINLEAFLSTPERQMTLAFGDSGPNKQKLQDLFVQWNASCGHSFHAIENPYLHAIWKELRVREGLPSRKVLKTLTTNYAARLRMEISKDMLLTTGRINLCLDAWTSSFNVSYIVIMAHYIDDDWIMQEQMLDFCHMPHGHSGHRMASRVFATSKEYNICHRLGTITTDNASDNARLMEELSVHLESMNIEWDPTDNHVHCMAHVINLAAQQFLRRLKASAPQRTERFSIDGLDDELDAQEDDVLGISAVLWRVRSFVKYVCASPQREAAFGQLQASATHHARLKLVKDVVTRWNSTFYMVARILRLKEIVQIYSIRTPDLPVNLRIGNADWVALQSLHDALLPFEMITQMICATHVPTLNRAWPAYAYLFNQMINWINNTTNRQQPYYKEMYDAYTNAKDKLQRYYGQTDQCSAYALACILDPEGKVEQLNHVDFKPADYIETLQILYSKEQEIIHQQQSTFEQENNADASRASGLSTHKINLASIRNVMTQSRQKKPRKDEVTRYLEEDIAGTVDESLLWWKINESRFPTLSKVAKSILSAVATSVGSERAFNMARDIHQYRRGQLGIDTISDIVMIKFEHTRKERKQINSSSSNAAEEEEYHSYIDQLRDEYNNTEQTIENSCEEQFFSQRPSRSSVKTASTNDQVQSTSSNKKRRTNAGRVWVSDAGPVRRKRMPVYEPNHSVIHPHLVNTRTSQDNAINEIFSSAESGSDGTQEEDMGFDED